MYCLNVDHIYEAVIAKVVVAKNSAWECSRISSLFLVSFRKKSYILSKTALILNCAMQTQCVLSKPVKADGTH